MEKPIKLSSFHWSYEEAKEEIEKAKRAKGTIDEFGDGYHHVPGQIMWAYESKSTYCGKPIPQELFDKEEEVMEEFCAAVEELDRASFDNLEAIMLAMGRPYEIFIGHNALCKDIITEEEYSEWCEKRQQLKESVFREKFVELGKRIKGLHDDYISFLESCLPDDSYSESESRE